MCIRDRFYRAGVQLTLAICGQFFYIGFLNCFCGILHDTIKIRKIAHDLSEHGIPYPALLFGPTNRAVFYRQKMLPEPAEQTPSHLPPERQQRRYDGQARRRHGNIGKMCIRDRAWGADRICRPMRGPTGEGERAAAPFLGKMDLMPVLTAKRKEKASEWSMSKLQRR